jgi:hypothetical protein
MEQTSFLGAGELKWKELNGSAVAMPSLIATQIL